ncbi:hypothetical protein J4E81_009336 [Alternaria sp. BMP 2799]|nr:hypothetical protein J4E81_009336 [Alternaria sp. BMP 2799]
MARSKPVILNWTIKKAKILSPPAPRVGENQTIPPKQSGNDTQNKTGDGNTKCNKETAPTSKGASPATS